MSDKTYKMTVTVYFSAKDNEEAQMIKNEMEPVDWDMYTASAPVEVHTDRMSGLSE